MWLILQLKVRLRSCPKRPPAIDPEMLKLAEIRQGDGVVRIVSRQLEAKPEAWGYDAAKDGDLHKWAGKMTHELMAKNQVSGDIRLNLDATHPGHVLVTPEGKIDISDAKTYLHKEIPVSQMPDPFEHDAPGAHVPVDKMDDPFEHDAPGAHLTVDQVPDEFEHDTPGAHLTVDQMKDPFEDFPPKGAVSHVEAQAAHPEPAPIYQDSPRRWNLHHQARLVHPPEMVDGNDTDIAKLREHAGGAQLEHADVMKSLKAFENPKLSATDRLEALKAACSEGQKMNLGFEVVNRGGKLLAKVGDTTITVTHNNVEVFSRLAKLMDAGQHAVVDPEGYQAEVNRVMKDLGLVRPDMAK
jgi:hypothetical protein